MDNLLGKLRKERKMSQGKLARILNTSPKNVSAWENGTRTPRPYMMQKIEDYFGISKEQIFFAAFDYSK